MFRGTFPLYTHAACPPPILPLLYLVLILIAKEAGQSGLRDFEVPRVNLWFAGHQAGSVAICGAAAAAVHPSGPQPLHRRATQHVLDGRGAS
jgi:hypothetical protein